MTLSDRDRAVLDFETAWAEKYGETRLGHKEEAILRDLNLRPARYYVLLDRLLDDLDAITYAPQLLNRLRRIRDAKTAERRRRLNL